MSRLRRNDARSHGSRVYATSQPCTVERAEHTQRIEADRARFAVQPGHQTGIPFLSAGNGTSGMTTLVGHSANPSAASFSRAAGSRSSGGPQPPPPPDNTWITLPGGTNTPTSLLFNLRGGAPGGSSV